MLCPSQPSQRPKHTQKHAVQKAPELVCFLRHPVTWPAHMEGSIQPILEALCHLICHGLSAGSGPRRQAMANALKCACVPLTPGSPHLRPILYTDLRSFMAPAGRQQEPGLSAGVGRRYIKTAAFRTKATTLTEREARQASKNCQVAEGTERQHQ